MRKVYKILRWDSKHFNYKVAAFSFGKLDYQAVKEILEKLKKSGARLVYWFVDPEDHLSNEAARLNKGLLVDRRVTYFRTLLGRVKLSNDENIVSYLRHPANKKLLFLALEAGVYSRFKTDPGFVQGEYRILYTEWIKNSLSGRLAKEVLVYMLDKEEVGMVTIGGKGKLASIGLLAVDRGFRRRGIGRNLLQAAINWSVDKGYKEIRVVTQRDNIPSCKLYESLGFSEREIKNVYHFWLK